MHDGKMIWLELKNGLEESLNASGAGLNLNVIDWSIYNNVV